MSKPNPNDTQAAGGGQGGGQDTIAGGGGGQGGGDPWYAKLTIDDDTRTYLTAKNFPSMEDALRAGMHANRVALNRNAIELPAADKLFEWDGFEKLGAPKDPAGYQFKLDGVKDEAKPEWDRMLAAIAPAMHKGRVLPQQAQMVVDAIRTYGESIEKASADAYAKKTGELDAALRTEWGQDYDKNRELSRRAMQFMGLPEKKADVLAELLGDADFVKGFHKFGALMSEDQLVAPGGQPGESPVSAQIKIERLKGDREFRAALADPRHPAHASSKAEWDRLNQLAAKEAGR